MNDYLYILVASFIIGFLARLIYDAIRSTLKKRKPKEPEHKGLRTNNTEPNFRDTKPVIKYKKDGDN